MLALRRAVLTHMKAGAALTALVPAASIHPQQPLSEPTWPFIRYGSPSSVPREAACLNGADVTFDVHAFAKPRYDAGGQMVETAEDHCNRIAEQIEARLHRSRLDITGGHISIRSTGTQILTDRDTPDAFHAVCSFRAKVTL